MFDFNVIKMFGRQAEATKILANGEEENRCYHIYPDENTIWACFVKYYFRLLTFHFHECIIP